MRVLKSIAMGFGFLAAIFVVVCGFDSIASFKQPVDLYAEETNINELGRTDAVEAEIYAILDCFAEETTTTKRNGATTSVDHDYYYIIPAYAGEEEYYIGVKVSSDDNRKYSDIADLTWEWLSGEPVELGSKSIVVEGCLKKMDDELYDYMVEWFEEAEWFATEEEIDQYVLPVCLEPVRFSTVKTMFLVSAIVLVLCVVIIVVSYISDKKQTKKASEQTHVVINGVSYPKSAFVNVDKFINQQEKIFAIQEVRQITGLGLAEAKEVVDNWGTYYWN